MAQNWKGGKLAAQKRYREKNRFKINKKKREYYKNNKDKSRIQQERYLKNNKDKVYIYNRLWQRRYRKKLKMQVITGYGGKCNCCGETEMLFLEIDHILNDGKTDRKRFNGPQPFYVWLIDNDFPKDKYQLLCANCNRGKARNGGICPHRMKNL
jgi:hypothetical protein